MANNYLTSSSFLEIPKDVDREKIKSVINNVIGELENNPDEGYCGCEVEVEPNGIWFYYSESINPDHVEIIARAVINEFKIDKPFYCSWAYTCDKPRIDEFGGGAFVIKRGFKTLWVDALTYVQDQCEKGLLTPE
jgi:hypothetical protein